LHIRPRFSVLTFLAALALFLFGAVHASASATIAATNLSLANIDGYAVYGVSNTVSTVLQLTTIQPTEGHLRYAGRDFQLSADTSAIALFGPQLGMPNFGVMRVSGTNTTASTFVTFKSPTGTRVTGYEIPLLTQKVADLPAMTEIRQLTNPADGTFGTSLLLFNVADEQGWVTATIYDDAQPGKVVAREYILTEPRGALTWYDLKTKFDSGRVELTRGMATGFGCYGCEPRGEVYGFAAIGTPNGDAPRLRPLIAKKPLSAFLP
jgi:hypothetical protein